jgi:UDP-N-acetylmuramate--alanine ligase
VNFNGDQPVHMVGVCGVGMAGVARLLAARGVTVSGCDAHPNELAAGLHAGGVALLQGHSPAHIDALPDSAVLIVTPAVPADEPEIAAARARGLRIMPRGEALASLVSGMQGVAVCGTHGKTTTACFTARLLQELGAAPGWCIGGHTRRMGSVAAPGDSEILVVEADESDGTLRHYHPAVTVLVNIDIDHLEHFAGEDDLVECFGTVLRQTRASVCVCRDDSRAWRTAGRFCRAPLSFGFHTEARLRAERVEVSASECRFTLLLDGADCGGVVIGVGGRHNILNALGAASAALALGFSAADIRRALPRACAELPGRRFEELGLCGGARYIADYAHHPAEIRAAVSMALACGGSRVTAVFQPHRYTRTLALGAQFPDAFSGTDEVVLLPVYAASEQPIPGGDICDLYSFFRSSLPDMRLTLADDLAACAHYLQGSAAAGDLVLLAGAGDVIELRDRLFGAAAERREGLACALRTQLGEAFAADTPLERFSVFPTRGRGMTALAPSCGALLRIAGLCRDLNLRWRPCGAGFNSWFGDCGCDGLLVRLEGEEFRALALEGGTVLAGCGVAGGRLLDFLQEHALGGLEFMEGIPGSLGGWLAMNAGAHGGTVGECVESVEIVDFRGGRITLPAEDCGFGYRRCAALESGCAVFCRLRLTRTDGAEIAQRRARYRAARIPLHGLRTAGSVFRNPPDDYAGRLLDEAGCRGLRIGGARVTEFHANIVVADSGCTASDIRALTRMMRNRVRFRSGVQLEYEIQGL